MKKQLLLFAVMLLVVVGAQAQRFGCLHDFMQTRANDTGYSLAFPFPFDPQKVYRQPVILISFNDADFSMDNPVAYYDSLFNEPGFNKGVGPGCVADDGTISFVFMNVDQSGVSATMFSDQSNDAWFTIDGRSLPNVPTAMGFYIHGGEKVIIR